MPISLNWFSTELTPTTFALPATDFQSYPHSTAALQGQLAGYDCYRPQKTRNGTEAVQVVVIYGSGTPPAFPIVPFNAANNPGLARSIILGSLKSHFRKQGAFVYQDRFALHCLWTVEEHEKAQIRMRSGIRVTVHRPSETDPYGLVITWEVEPQFTASLEDSRLQQASEGLSVLLRFQREDWTPPEGLAKYRNKYVGEVQGNGLGDSISIAARDGQSYSIPAKHAFLEASPRNMNELQHRLNTPYPIRRLQELSLVLTKDGRRNSSVLRDRLNAIRNKLSPRETNSLIIPLQVYGGGKALVDTNPLVLSNEAV